MKRLITATLYALLCLPMVSWAASTPISQAPDAGTLTGAEKIPIGRVGGTTAISTTTGALLNRSNHTGTQPATTIATDDTHQFASTAEKSAWNAKQDALGFTPLSPSNNLSDLASPATARASLGLGNVSNTADSDKPVSAPMQAALNAKAPLAAPTFTNSVTAPSFNSNAADGYHFILPYNSIAFAGTPLVGMIQTTPTGPQWYTGSAWEAIGSGGDSLPTQTGNSGKYLTTNGTSASWGTIAAGSGIAISTDIPTETGAANLNDTTHVLTVASSTGYTQFTGSFTAWDTTPAAFSFTDLTDVALSTAQTATPVQITGINYPTAVTASGGTAAICTGATVGTCGTFSASPGNVALNQYVSAQHASSGSNSTAVDTIVTIGGVSDTFTSTTAGQAYNDILFFWRAESTSLSAGDYPASGTISGSAGLLVAESARIGSYGVLCDDIYKYLSKTVTSSDFLDPTQGVIAFWFRKNSAWDVRSLARYYVDGNNAINIAGATGGNISATYRSAGLNAAIATSSNALTYDTWYFLEYAYNTTTDTHSIKINGNVVASGSLTLDAVPGTGTIDIGSAYSSTGVNESIDNVMVSNDPSRDFYGGGTGLCVNTSSPR